MDHKVNVAYLKLGMYVSNLDRPWIDTPFLLEGFSIQTEDDLSALSQYCSYVYIDTDRGIGASQYIEDAPRLKTNPYLERFLQDNRKKVEYENTRSTKEELPSAKVALEDASNQVAHIMEDVKDGKNLNIEAVRGVVEPILDSIIRNSEAYMWLSMMQKKSAYTYSHSVDNCALAIAFGRFMGLPKKDLRTLAIGLLMMDMGNVHVPEGILNKKGRLTEAEYRIVKKHVGHGVEILKTTKGMNEDITNIALTHHERFDGSGYPGALQGTQIPVYGRMAAIIDCYDAMTSNRPYSAAKSAYAALQNIYNWRGTAFQPELVEQFLQCIGVYPTGSLVEMTNGSVAIVLEQNLTQRMRPKIMLILDEDKAHLAEYKIMNLTEQFEDASKLPLNIYRGLDPGAYDIDPTEYYL
ncbi:MAG: HD-GYP domain-containing protein [Proteobacteria bacterium]|nr:HD-GYP domain-containing protein [Pseudomonadota bacterium]